MGKTMNNNNIINNNEINSYNNLTVCLLSIRQVQ